MLIVRAVDCEPRCKQRAQSGALRSFMASLRVKRFYALRDRNWLWAEGLRMRFRLHKRNRVFMLLLARRFLKVESPPCFHSAVACNARAEPHSTGTVIMHWLLNGCSAGRRATRQIREYISFSPTGNFVGLPGVCLCGTMEMRAIANTRKYCASFNSYYRLMNL